MVKLEGVLVMPVYLSYGRTWLKLKSAQTAASTSSSRGRRRQKRSAPYGLVAESVDTVDVKGLIKVYETLVPATKVSRFASKLLKELPETIIALIKPYGEDYIVEFYAKNSSYASTARAAAEKVLKELRVLREEVEEEEEAAEEETTEGEEEE